MKNAFLLVVTFLLFAFNLFGQKEFSSGYIITNSNDTLEGFIANNSYQKNSLICEFKDNNLSSVQKYKPKEIHSYKFNDGKYYVSKQIWKNNQKLDLYLEFLIKGKLNIYYLRLNNIDMYFAQIENDSILYLENNDIFYDYDPIKGEWIFSEEKTIQKVKQSNRYKGILTVLLQDTPKIQKKTESISLSHKSLINLAKDYHYSVCDNEDCIIYEKKNRTKLWIGITSSYSFTNYLNADSRTDRSFINNTFSYPGLFFSVQLLGIGEKLNLNAELFFSEINSFVETSTDGIEIKGLAASFPVELGYDFSSKKIIPYVNLGVIFHYLINPDITTYSILNETVYNKKTNATYTRDYESLKLGGTMSAGLKYSIHKYQIDLGMDYSIYSVEQNINSTRIRIGFAYLFNANN